MEAAQALRVMEKEFGSQLKERVMEYGGSMLEEEMSTGRPHTVGNMRRFLGAMGFMVPDCLVALTDGAACARETYTKHFAMLNLLQSMPSTCKTRYPTLM